MSLIVLLLSSLPLLAPVGAQQVGTLVAETHPLIPWQKCTGPGSCTTTSGRITLDSNYRWVHSTSGYTNCYSYSGNWDPTFCPDPTTCAHNCALEGADYAGTYGITTSGYSLTLKFVTQSSAGPNVGSRSYLMATDTNYQVFKLLNQELSFDVDVSQLPCGLNGALYFVEMDADGGSSKYPGNKAGAKYGTGYCDSHCPQDLQFINGQANIPWTSTSSTTGKGPYGSCCGEVDVWQANSISTNLAVHPCSTTGQTRCTAPSCTSCDANGCDFNPYRLGATTYYGPSKTVDTTKKFTVITQFLTSDGTATGTLLEIRRLYIQNGVVIQNAVVEVPLAEYDSITSNFCAAEEAWFSDPTTFQTLGGLPAVGQSLARGVVMAFSITEDPIGNGSWPDNMLWLDGLYPPGANPTSPGVLRGTCSTSSGARPNLEANSPNAQVVFSNIKVGPVGQWRYTSTTTTSAPASTTTSPLYAQCGGLPDGDPDPIITCPPPYVCVYLNPYYSQCQLPS